MVKGVAGVFGLLLLALFSLSACGGQNDTAQIKAVIEKADHEQEDAFVAKDASVMSDTTTAQYFAQMQQANESIAAQGGVGIKLSKLEWGPINVTSTTQAIATTWETWDTTFQGGQTVSQREQNVYTLLKIGGSWKIDRDVYPEQSAAPQSQTTPGTGPSISQTPRSPISTPASG